MLQSFSGIKYREEHGYFQKTFRKNWDIVDKGRCQTLTFAIQQMKPDLDLTTLKAAMPSVTRFAKPMSPIARSIDLINIQVKKIHQVTR